MTDINFPIHHTCLQLQELFPGMKTEYSLLCSYTEPHITFISKYNKKELHIKKRAIAPTIQELLDKIPNTITKDYKKYERRIRPGYIGYYLGSFYGIYELEVQIKKGYTAEALAQLLIKLKQQKRIRK